MTVYETGEIHSPLQTGPAAGGVLGRHLLDIDSLGATGIEYVLSIAESLRAGGTSSTADLRGRTVVNLFYEASTRTRISFEVAARKLGAEVVNVASGTSSVSKGESLVDTVRTLEALGADALVIRHPEAGVPYLAARHFGGSVLNAGDGRHAHPTQALLDLMTLREHWPDLRGLRVAIVGDILHSRVVRSTAVGLLLCGADVRLSGPRTLLPPEGWLHTLPCSERGGVATQTASLEDALEGAQVVYALRMQGERQDARALPPLKEYVRQYGITQAKLDALAPGALVMHPGPANAGVELESGLIAASNSLIPRQVMNGVLVRMAVLVLLLGGHE